MASEPSETRDRPFPISSVLIETIAWAAGVIGLMLATAAIVIGTWDHDGGFFLLRGSYVAQGLRPFIDYTTKYPPVVDIITALWVRTDASRLFLTISIPFAWILANSIASGVLTWTITRSRATATLIAALFPLFTIENGGNHVTLEHGVTFFTLLALAAIASEVTPLDARRLTLCGICVGAAILSKQNGVIALIPVAAIVYSRRTEVTRKMVGAFIAGLAVVPLLILIWLRFDVVSIYRGMVAMLFEYAAKSATLRHDGWLWEFIYAPSSAYLYVIVIIAAFVVIMDAPRWRLIAAAGLLGAVIEGLPRIMRDYRHYNLNMWAFMVLVLALAAAQPDVHRRAAVIAVLLVFASAANFRQLRMTWSTDSLLFRVFTPTAHIVEASTPPNAKVRQYGAEPIIEFLAKRREDRIDKGNETALTWDGSGVYDDIPAKETTVVVVDQGQLWIAPLFRDLVSWRFKPIAQFGVKPRITVFRSLDAPRK